MGRVYRAISVNLFPKMPILPLYWWRGVVLLLGSVWEGYFGEEKKRKRLVNKLVFYLPVFICLFLFFGHPIGKEGKQISSLSLPEQLLAHGHYRYLLGLVFC